MIRLRNAVVALATCLLAVGAVAQDEVGFMQDSVSVTVADELFGGGDVELEFKDFDDMAEGFTPLAKLIFTGATSIAAATEFTVTYTLTSGELAESVSNADFMWGSWGPANTTRGGTDCDTDTQTPGEPGAADLDQLVFCEVEDEINFSRVDGRKGQNSVSFEVEVPAEITDLATPTLTDTDPITDDDTDGNADYTDNTTRKIVLVLPDVETSGATSVRISVEQPNVNSGATEISETIVMANTCGMHYEMPQTSAVTCPIVKTAKVIDMISNDGGEGRISLAADDERKVLVVPANAEQQVRVSTVRVIPTAAFQGGGVMDTEGNAIVPGEPASDAYTGVVDGSLAISVTSGRFNEGDMVYVDTDADGEMDDREAFAMESGEATAKVDLGTVALNVYYVPSGDDALKHETEFTTNATTEFLESGNKTISAMAAKATLRLDGIDGPPAKAYAIVSTAVEDKANVRVTCEHSNDPGCTVFLECRDHDSGEPIFDEDGAIIPPDTTVVWNQDMIEEALGLTEPWTGRLSCDILSTEPISVQVLTRSHGVLVNNTPINSGGG